MTTDTRRKGFLQYINDFYKDLDMHEICLVYEGQVTHHVMKALTGLIEEQLIELAEKETVQRRVYHVMVESLQNINRHAEVFEIEGESHPGKGIILVSKQTEQFRVISGNIISNSYVDEISEFLGKLNLMEPDTLDDMYKKQLRGGQLSPEGGAGLGFIDIRRKTGLPVDYYFTKIDRQTSFFIICATIIR